MPHLFSPISRLFVVQISAILIVALPALAREENGTTFNAKSATIYYEVLGSGDTKPLIVVNGGPGFDHTYEHVSSAWEVLAKKRRVIFYEIGRAHV